MADFGIPGIFHTENGGAVEPGQRDALPIDAASVARQKPQRKPWLGGFLASVACTLRWALNFNNPL